jgi:nucleoside-diphosphate-sugar epimerase
MVVGNGMMAQAFAKFKKTPEVIIYASGVSNSNVTDLSELHREVETISQYLNTSECLVYFSTLSIYDSTVQNSLHVQHKKRMEELIKTSCKKYIIFRIPIVIGKSNNPHTLINTLLNQIRKGETLRVFKKAFRYVIDIDDIVEIATPIILNQKNHNSIWNMCFNNNTSIQEIITYIEDVIGIVAKKQYIDKGDKYIVPNDNFLQYLDSIGYKLPTDYINQTLKKYYKQYE